MNKATSLPPLKLWYEQPADSWEKRIPLGNGSLGAMLSGGIEREEMDLNEDTLWSGYPKDTNHQGAAQHLESVRQKVFAGEYLEAQTEIEQHMLGDYDESYLPMASLQLSFEEQGAVCDYRRELNLRSAVSSVCYTAQNAEIKRSAFVSAVHGVLVYRIETGPQTALRCRLSLDSKLRHAVDFCAPDLLQLTGESPAYLPPHNPSGEESILYGDIPEKRGMRFGVFVKVLAPEAALSVRDGVMEIHSTGGLTLLVAAGTSFNGYDKQPYQDGKDFAAQALARLETAAQAGYEALLQAHVQDHDGLFGKVQLTLTAEPELHQPTDRRVLQAQQGKDDPALAALLFQYGRYLLIASSRPGTQPANLQGIWNSDLPPYWSSNWTTNINTQMNYWPAEVCNLSACHMPLLQMIEDLMTPGAETARIHYGCRGWVAHHNVDLWRKTSPGEHQFDLVSARYSYWPMGSAWLCLHLWEHYDYTRDEQFLRLHAYPAMKGAAQFYLDYLVEGPQGALVTCPSTSPENAFLNSRGESCGVSYASTMDITLIWELFSHCIESCRILQTDTEFSDALQAARDRLYPLHLGKHGQLLEWAEDYEETEPGHRHMSHLLGLFPGTRLLCAGDAIMQAARVSIARRLNGEKRHGWGLAWLIALYARLGEGELAADCVREMLRESVYPNLLDRHPPLSAKERLVFQIDGNFGYTAGVAEMLLQSHCGCIALLPALPACWDEGSVSGLCARGGYTVDIWWKKGRLERVRVHSAGKGECTLRYRDKALPLTMQPGEAVEYGADVFAPAN